MKHSLRGPMFAVSSACASSNDALGIAYDLIARGDALAMVTGGAEATITDVAMGGFDSMKALSTRNDEPERASRPFDRERDGFVLAEGGAVLIFEELEFARKRGARIYAEMLGYGQSADAYHLVAADPTGDGRRARDGARCSKAPDSSPAMSTTSTRMGPRRRSAIRPSRRPSGRILGTGGHAFAVSSTKSMHGHALGAAGAIEGVATVLAIARGLIPPTINYEFPDPECRLDYVPNVARKASVEVALSNAFGFGGHNSVVVFGRYRE